MLTSTVKEQVIARLEQQAEAFNDPSCDHVGLLQYRLAEMVAGLVVMAYGDYDKGVKDLVGELIGFFYEDYNEGVAELNKYLELRNQEFSQVQPF
jgi:hypothetical protein